MNPGNYQGYTSALRKHNYYANTAPGYIGNGSPYAPSPANYYNPYHQPPLYHTTRSYNNYQVPYYSAVPMNYSSYYSSNNLSYNPYGYQYQSSLQSSYPQYLSQKDLQIYPQSSSGSAISSTGLEAILIAILFLVSLDLVIVRPIKSGK